MSKIKLPIALVVEGVTDQQFLSGFLDVEFILTNGSEISRGTLDYIKNLAQTKPVVVLTDPDSPGERIRARIQEEVPNVSHAFVRKAHSIKKHKVGVAESTKEEVLLALKNILPGDFPKGNLTSSDLMDLGLTGKEDSSRLRMKIEDRFSLGHGSAKTFLSRINALGISKEELQEALYGRE